MSSSPGRDLLVIGSGGFGRETVEAVRAINAVGGAWRILGYLDDDPALSGKNVNGVSVIGGLAAVASYPDALLVVCTGRPDNYLSRPRIVGTLDLPPGRYAPSSTPPPRSLPLCQSGPDR